MNTIVRRGRPKDPQKQQSILQAAAELFMREGLDVSMDAISKAAGVSKQTLYSHFGGKEELFEEVISCKVDVYFPESDLVRGESLEEELLDRGQRVLDMLSEPNVRMMGHVVASACSKHPEIGDQFFRSGPDFLCSKITSTFARHDRQGRFEPHEETARSFVGALAGHLMMTNMYAPQRALEIHPEFLAKTVQRFLTPLN